MGMPVAELLSRLSSAELTEWYAFDQLESVDMKWKPPTAPPERAMAPDRVFSKLDRAFPPVPHAQ